MEFKCANITGYNFAITENILVQTMKFHLYDMLVPRTKRTQTVRIDSIETLFQAVKKVSNFPLV